MAPLDLVLIPTDTPPIPLREPADGWTEEELDKILGRKGWKFHHVEGGMVLLGFPNREPFDMKQNAVASSYLGRFSSAWIVRGPAIFAPVRVMEVLP